MSQLDSEIKSANGATVAYNQGDVKVKYTPCQTDITRTDKVDPDVYIPITNPLDRSWELDNATIYFDSIEGGEVTGFEIYYGNVFIYSKVKEPHFTTWSQNIEPTVKTADIQGYGILVTLHLKLPEPESGIKLYTVDLTFIRPPTGRRTGPPH